MPPRADWNRKSTHIHSSLTWGYPFFLASKSFKTLMQQRLLSTYYVLGIHSSRCWGNSNEQNVNIPMLMELLSWRKDTMNIMTMICSVLVIRAVAENTQRNFGQAKRDWKSWGREMHDNFKQSIGGKPHLDSEP